MCILDLSEGFPSIIISRRSLALWFNNWYKEEIRHIAEGTGDVWCGCMMLLQCSGADWDPFWREKSIVKWKTNELERTSAFQSSFYLVTFFNTSIECVFIAFSVGRFFSFEAFAICDSHPHSGPGTIRRTWYDSINMLIYREGSAPQDGWMLYLYRKAINNGQTAFKLVTDPSHFAYLQSPLTELIFILLLLCTRIAAGGTGYRKGIPGCQQIYARKVPQLGIGQVSSWYIRSRSTFKPVVIRRSRNLRVCWAQPILVFLTTMLTHTLSNPCFAMDPNIPGLASRVLHAQNVFPQGSRSVSSFRLNAYPYYYCQPRHHTLSQGPVG